MAQLPSSACTPAPTRPLAHTLCAPTLTPAATLLPPFRCAFGHTCKFHHPELPAGPGLPLYAMAPGYPVPGYPMGATVGSPVLGSVLGLHGKPGGPMGGPGPHLVSGASPPGGPQGFYMPSPYAGV